MAFYCPVVNYVLPKEMKERVAPSRLTSIALSGLTVLNYYIKWLTDRSLIKSSIASEVKIIAKAVDALISGTNDNSINEYPIELLMRRLYGFEQAFNLVYVEKDWKPPRDESSRKGWKSKVNWGLMELYDLHALEGEVNSLPSVDAEAASVAETQRRFENYATQLNSVTPGPNASFARVIAGGDGN
jgi:hypothetical protein